MNPRDKLDAEYYHRSVDIQEHFQWAVTNLYTEKVRRLEDLRTWYRMEIARLDEPILIQTKWGVLFG
jgi:hypothetical protein